MLVALLVVLIVLGLTGGLSFAGLWLCWHGLWGRVLDEHPRCRKCRYDLYGHGVLPEQCPECGGNLWLIDAIIVGRREMKPDRCAAGVVCLALGILPIAWMIYDSKSAAAAPVAAAAAPQQAQPPVPRWNRSYVRSAAAIESDKADGEQDRRNQLEQTQQLTSPKVRIRTALEYELEGARNELNALVNEERKRLRRTSSARDEDHSASVTITSEFDHLLAMPRLDGWYESAVTSRDERRRHTNRLLRSNSRQSLFDGSELHQSANISIDSVRLNSQHVSRRLSSRLSGEFASSFSQRRLRSITTARFEHAQPVRRQGIDSRLRSEQIPSTRVRMDRW